MNLNPGDTVYKYALELLVGSGHFGQVWKGRDLAIDREVALKILPVTFDEISTSLEEAIIGNKLTHENLIHVYSADVQQVDNQLAMLISMDFLAGGSILTKASVGNFLTVPDVLKSLQEVLRGLIYLHEAGIFHNDIKPTNILIGHKGQAVLSDFGISSLLLPGEIPVAKNRYFVNCAPETHATQLISIQSDIYQLGITAYRLLNGIHRISDDLRALGISEFERRKCIGTLIKKDDYEPWVPTSVRKIVNKAMHLDPRQRYSSAVEMLRALENLHFAGYWQQLADGSMIGVGRKFSYSTVTSLSGGKYCVESTRISSGRSTKITKFCCSGLTNKDAAKLSGDFMRWVVNSAS